MTEMNAFPPDPATPMEVPALATSPAPSAEHRSTSPVSPVRVLCVGNAGLRILAQVAAAIGNAAHCVAVHADDKRLSASPAAEKIHLRNLRLTGLGASSPEQIRSSAEEQVTRIKALCQGSEVVVLVSGLGGGLGTVVAPVVAAAAREAGAVVLGCVALPFECEGSLRARAAQASLARLKDSADLIICQANQKAIALLDENTSLAETFRITNELWSKTVMAIWQGLTTNTAMGLPFTDLCALLRHQSKQCVLAVVDAGGPNRAAEAVNKLVAHPLLGGAAGLQAAPMLAVSLVGTPSLAMAEVNRLMERLRHESGGVPLIMGAAVGSESADNLRVSVLVSLENGPGQEDDLPQASAGSLGRSKAEDETVHPRFLDTTLTPRTSSRFVPPPPATTPEKLELLRRQRKPAARLRQTQLPLEIVSKGRFEKSEPTIYRGEDLDIPTYVRRRVALN